MKLDSRGQIGIAYLAKSHNHLDLKIVKIEK